MVLYINGKNVRARPKQMELDTNNVTPYVSLLKTWKKNVGFAIIRDRLDDKLFTVSSSHLLMTSLRHEVRFAKTTIETYNCRTYEPALLETDRTRDVKFTRPRD